MRFAPLLSLLAVTACASSSDKGSEFSFIPEGAEYAPWQVSDQGATGDGGIGITMASLDRQIRAWSNIELKGGDDSTLAAQRRIAQKIGNDTAKKFSIVEQQLQSGPLYNRQVAAMALGFTENPRALPPLLLALGDLEPAVVANAALGLSRLSMSETDLTPLLTKIDMEQPTRVRVNASLAIKNVITAGNKGEGAAPERSGAAGRQSRRGVDRHDRVPGPARQGTGRPRFGHGPSGREGRSGEVAHRVLAVLVGAQLRRRQDRVVAMGSVEDA